MTVHGWIRWVEGLLEPSEHFKVALAVFVAIAFVCSIKTIVENVNHPKGGHRGKSVRQRKVTRAKRWPCCYSILLVLDIVTLCNSAGGNGHKGGSQGLAEGTGV